MNGKRLRKRIVSFVLALSIIVTAVGCSFSGKDGSASPNASIVTNDADTVVIDDVAINDSFVTLEIKGIENTSVKVENIDVDQILVNCIKVTEIDTIEVEVTSINDEFVYLAYKNFVSVYGDDFDLKDFLMDSGIGAGCILICVTLSAVGGPVGTFFGAVITSQFTTSAVVVGAAIDAAVSAYQAYQEGGDLSYIIGHMLNGVADGFKWSAILAPLTGAIDGIKALRAVSALRKVPGFEEVKDKEARKIFECLAEVLRKSADVGDNLTDDAIKELYQSFSKDITEDMLRNILKNSGVLTDIVKKFNPFNVSREVVKAMQNNFMKRSGLTDDILKAIRKGTIRNLDGIEEPVVREFLGKNMYEFVECFGNSLSKDFVDGCLKKNVGEDAFKLIQDSITSNELYVDLIKKLGKNAADDIVSDADNLILIQLRYGTKNANRLINAGELYRQIVKNHSIPEEQVRKVLNGLMDGTIKSLDEISEINTQIAKNICGSREIIAQSIRNLGNEKAFSGLLDDIARNSLESLSFVQNMDRAAEVSEDIMKNSMTKAEIVAKYGEDVYRELTSNYIQVVSCLKVRVSVNKTFIEEMTTDALKNHNLKDGIIKNILSGKRIEEWGIKSTDDIMKISNIVADYYRINDETVYRNYVKELAELRGEAISDFLETYRREGNTIKNIRYAGTVMSPPETYTASQIANIKAKYGDIYMSTNGFPIFDEYAIGRVEIPDLTGLNGGADDIAKANLLHHGTRDSIPGYTWHHLEDGKTMILIPTDLHEAYRHTGGADLLREGLKGAM